MSERTDLECGCAYVKAGGQSWQVVACPVHEMDMRPQDDAPQPQPLDFPRLLRRAGIAIRLCFEPATREHLEDYVEDFNDADLGKLADAALRLHASTQYALGRRLS